MARSTEKTLVWIIRLCAGGILALPLLVTWNTMFPFIFGKMTAFRILVDIAGAAWVVLLIQNPSYRPPWRHPVIIATTLFIGSLVLTMFTGVDPWRSFWSTQERMTGVLSFVHFWALVLMLPSTLKTWREWRLLFFVSLIVNAIVNMYGVMAPREVGQVVVSTLGNPIYVGVYALLHIFMGMFLVFFEKKRLIQAVLAGSIALNLWMIVIAGSRSVLYSLLAALAVFVIFFIFSFFSSSKRMRKSLLAGFGILLVLGGIAVAWLKTEEGRAWGITNLPYTINRAFYGSSASNEDRFALWKIGLIGFRDRPLFGWGWENYRTIYEKHLVPRPFMDQWYDRSHNQIIDILALTGIVGTVSYGAMWCLILFALLKIFLKIDDQRVRFGAASLLAFFLSYFLQNLTIFDSPAPLILYFFILAFVVFFSQKQGLQRMSEERGGRPSIPNAIVILPIAALFLLCIYFFNIAPFLRSSEGVKGIFLLTSDPRRGAELLKKSLSTRSFANSELLVQEANSIEAVWDSPDFSLESGEKVQLLRFFEEKYESYLLKRNNPNNIQHYIRFTSMLINLYGLTADKSYLEKAERVLSIAKEVSPQRYEVYAQFAWLAIIQDEGEKARDYATQALTVVSDKERPMAIWIFAHAAFLTRDVRQGFESLEKAAEGDFAIYEVSNLAVPLALAVSNEDRQYLAKAIEYIDRATEKNPKDIFFQSAKVIIYEKAGKKRESQELFETIKNQNPDAARQILELKKQGE